MTSEEKVKSYKGFDKDLKCRDFQYEIGKTYHHNRPIVPCESGFHAIGESESPLSVFGYYPPSGSRYCEVMIGGETKEYEDKIVGSEITIGAEIGIPGIVKAHVEWVKRRLIDDGEHKLSNTGDRSSASNTGDRSSAEVSGKDSVAIATGKDCKVRGSLGCAIVVAERGEWNGETYPLIRICSAIVDGVKIKADTWYTAKNGQLVEVNEEEEE